MQLSPNFHLSEMVASQTASRRGIANVPPQHVIDALRDLCIHVLEPVRLHFGKPVMVSSGYRSPKLNAAVGGSKSSDHMLGRAADIEIPGVSNFAVANFIRLKLPFDQLILEHYTPGQPNSGWVHVSWQPTKRRHEVLTATIRRVFGRSKTVYLPGLVA